MGSYYYYVNDTKRERFCIDALGGDCRIHAIGRTLASRAFHLLLVRPPSSPESANAQFEGRWAGDSISIVADDSTPNFTELTDIRANAILSVFRIDGFEEIGNAADAEVSLFMELCHLVVTRQVIDLEPHLKSKFGAQYLSRYKDLCKEPSRCLLLADVVS